MEPKRAKVLTPARFRHLLRVTEATSRFPERDTLLGVTCGMRVTEIARIEVRDVIAKSGSRREEVGLRGSITKGCRPRCIYLAHERTIAAFDRYIEWRYKRGAGTALDRREYRGLMPHTRLILTQKGSAFELSVKRRVDFDGETVEYLAAVSLQSYVTGLYGAAGLGAGYSSHTGRRTFASRLVAQGHSLDTVQLLLGHSHLDHISAYLDVTVREQRDALSAFDCLEWDRRKLRNEPISGKSRMPFSMIAMLAILRLSAIIDSNITGVIAMANLLVRNVDDSLVQSLRELAAAHGRSAEAEHREILAKALRKPKRKSFAEVLTGIPNVGADSDFERVDDGEASRVFG